MKNYKDLQTWPEKLNEYCKDFYEGLQDNYHLSVLDTHKHVLPIFA